MDAMLDKKIREKINSLDTLPEGYTPSLDSKWELLLQAREPKKKKLGGWYLYAAAAMFLLALGFGWLLLQTRQELPTPLAEAKQPKAVVETPAAKVLETLAPQKAESAAAKQTETTTPAPKPANKNLPARQTKTPAQIEAPLAEASENSAPNQLVTEDLPPVALAGLEKREMPKTGANAKAKKKARMVEIDFAGTPVQPQPLTAEVAQQTFQFKLFPRAQTTTPEVVRHESPLKLKRSL